MAQIYVLVDPRDGDIRYVGLTIQALAARYKVHICTRTPRRCHSQSWIKNVQRSGHQPIMRLVQEVPDVHGKEAERYWIAYFRSIGCDLVNHTDGGEGTKGYRHDDETRRKMSASHTGKSCPWNSQSTKRRWEKWRAEGGVVSDETRRKISEANTGRRRSKEDKEKISARQKGRRHSPETKAKMAASARARWARQRQLSEA